MLTQRYTTGRVVALAFCLTTPALYPEPSLAASHSGTARVVDGDGLWIDNAEYRLHGIDALESDQGCKDSAGRLWRCGQKAKETLKALTNNQTVTCEWQTLDRYGRRIATCHVNDIDLAAAMVYTGYAVAYRRYSDKYTPFENEARNNQSGIWSGTFEQPEYHRKNGRKLEIPPPDSTRLIKGNINRKGSRYYHCPGDRSYSKTRITEAKGEKWFSSSAEAESSGWIRAPGAGHCQI